MKMKSQTDTSEPFYEETFANGVHWYRTEPFNAWMPKQFKMKSTQERLSESYCRPTTPEEWEVFGLIPLSGHYVTWLGGEPTLISGKFADRTEIPVSHFLDLLHDRIVPWRLEEDGFVFYASTGQHVLYTTRLKRYHVTMPPISNTVKFYLWSGDKAIEADNIITYTDLLTLIRLIG